MASLDEYMDAQWRYLFVSLSVKIITQKKITSENLKYKKVPRKKVSNYSVTFQKFCKASTHQKSFCQRRTNRRENKYLIWAVQGKKSLQFGTNKLINFYWSWPSDNT